MNKEEMQKYIEALEKERDHNAMKIDNLEMRLREMNEAQDQLNHTLMSLISKPTYDDISEIKRLANRIKQYADCWPDEPNEEVKK